MTKAVLGLSFGFLIGLLCRYIDFPVPSPPKLLGALLVLSITLGYMAMDWYLLKKLP